MNPGGLMNAISKKPPSEPLRYVETGIDNHGNRYGAFDFGGPVGHDGYGGQWFYRLTGLARGGATHLLAGDHAALPAIGSILEYLPYSARGLHRGA